MTTTSFQLPIHECDPETVFPLSSTLMNDIELVEPRPENETGLSLYGALCNPTHPLEHAVMRQMASNYTTDISFLTEHQHFIASIAVDPSASATPTPTPVSVPANPSSNPSSKYAIYDEWKEWKEMSHESFANTYMFLDGAWMPEQMLHLIQPHIHAFNSSAIWQQAMHMYNLLSPFLAVLLPILLLLVMPFASLLLLQHRASTEGANVFSWKEYMACIHASLQSGPPFFRIFTDFASSDWKNRLYLVGTFFFYLFSMYGNVMVCISSYRNCDRIYSHLRTHWQFLTRQLQTLQRFRDQCAQLSHTAWSRFRDRIQEKMQTITSYISAIEKVFAELSLPLLDDPTSFPTPSSQSSVESSVEKWKKRWMRTMFAGPAMSLFYRIVHDAEYADVFEYACHFDAWSALLEKVAHRVQRKELNAVSWKSGKVRIRMRKMSFPPFLPSPDADAEKRVCVRNHCSLSRNVLLSGTNASGKTTYMKTVLFNLILSQQLGVGCFQKATLTPFSHFHCYLSIPDTSGRDSLFQAEARRCKEMLDAMDAHREGNHFCIFDELFSGTNPAEAVVSAEGFLRYIAQHRNVRFLVSTHFVELCEQLGQHKAMRNRHMKQYRLRNGIGYERGGISVLHQLQYPSSILEWAKRAGCNPRHA